MFKVVEQLFNRFHAETTMAQLSGCCITFGNTPAEPTLEKKQSFHCELGFN